jgi:hypothetical protein
VHVACLVINDGAVSGRSKNIGSQSRYINPAHLPCFGRLLIGQACLLCFINVPASSALVEVDFSQNDTP